MHVPSTHPSTHTPKHEEAAARTLPVTNTEKMTFFNAVIERTSKLYGDAYRPARRSSNRTFLVEALDRSSQLTSCTVENDKTVEPSAMFTEPEKVHLFFIYNIQSGQKLNLYRIVNL